MNALIIVVIGIFVLGILFRILGPGLQRQSKDETSFPYELQSALFTPAERSFLGVLDQAVAGKYRIFGKVRIADVATVRGTPNQSTRQRAFNKISAKHFDFLLCDPGDLSFVCAIELDDKSHAQDKRKERDQFVENICAAMKLPLLRFPAKRGYTVDSLREAIANLHQPEAAVVGGSEGAIGSDSPPKIAKNSEQLKSRVSSSN